MAVPDAMVWLILTVHVLPAVVPPLMFATKYVLAEIFVPVITIPTCRFPVPVINDRVVPVIDPLVILTVVAVLMVLVKTALFDNRLLTRVKPYNALVTAGKYISSLVATAGDCVAGLRVNGTLVVPDARYMGHIR